MRVKSGGERTDNLVVVSGVDGLIIWDVDLFRACGEVESFGKDVCYL